MCNWEPIDTAPFDCDLQLSVIDGEIHALVFSCRRTEAGWVNSQVRQVDITVIPRIGGIGMR
jgi:hypothetical protein